MGYSYLLPTRRLAQGSRPPTDVRLPFEVIVLAAHEYQPRMRGYQLIRIPLRDAKPSHADRARIVEVALDVAERVRRGDRVLVTCNQGRNRSGVIAGIAMVELGVDPNKAAAQIRHLRNGLTNPYFHRMVVGY